MKDKHHKKIYQVSKDGKGTMYPYLIETKEKGKLRIILKRLIHFKKGHWKETLGTATRYALDQFLNLSLLLGTFMVGGTTAGNVSFVGSFAGSPGFTAGPFGAGAFSTTQNAVIPLLVSSDVAEIHAIINQSGAGATSFDAKMSSVPEPSTLLLLGAGLAGVGIFRRRFKR